MSERERQRSKVPACNFSRDAPCLQEKHEIWRPQQLVRCLYFGSAQCTTRCDDVGFAHQEQLSSACATALSARVYARNVLPSGERTGILGRAYRKVNAQYGEG